MTTFGQVWIATLFLQLSLAWGAVATVGKLIAHIVVKFNGPVLWQYSWYWVWVPPTIGVVLAILASIFLPALLRGRKR